MFKNINDYRNKIILLSVMWALLLIAVFTWSVLTGQYPLTLKGLLSGDTMSIMVFKRLRLPRAIMGIIGGFGLSISGYVYQMIFKIHWHHLMLSVFLPVLVPAQLLL